MTASNQAAVGSPTLAAVYADQGRAVADRDLPPVGLMVISTDRDRALADRDRALADRDRVLADRDRAVAELTAMTADRDRVLADRDRAVAGLTAMTADRDRAVAGLTTLTVDRDLVALLAERDCVIAQVFSLFVCFVCLL
jgi:hypothetical protein